MGTGGRAEAAGTKAQIPAGQKVQGPKRGGGGDGEDVRMCE